MLKIKPKIVAHPKSNPIFTLSKKNQGMTFIEVLVSLVILVTGILGAVAMQASAKKGSFDAMQRSVASAVAQDIIERIRSNSASTTMLSTYAGTYGAAARTVPANRCDKPNSLCTPANMMTNDLYEWTNMLMGADAKDGSANAGGLVGARGCITQTAQVIEVVISWEGRIKTVDGGSGSCGISSTSRRQLSMKTFIF